jgi:hypothetical protein
MSFIIGANSAVGGGYDVANSCRFNDGSSDYLNKTFGTPGGGIYKWTYSFWVKRSSLGEKAITAPYYSGSFNGIIRFTSGDALEVYDYRSGMILQKITSRLFRDLSAWYHIVVSNDNSVASPETEIYVNGVKETSFSTTNEYSQNETNSFNNDYPNYIGQTGASSQYFDGYISEFVYIDGTALDPTSFGEFDEDSGIWKPIDVSGLTFGDNGFYLDFEDSSALGDDVSGNGNDFTVNNLTAIDQSTDTCTNNFATLNPLIYQSRNNTFAEGNLKVTSATSDAWDTHYGISTIAVSSGKWYVESKVTTTTTSQAILGLISTSQTITSSLKDNGVAAVEKSGRITGGGINIETGLTAFSNGDIAAIAFDADAGTAQFYRNGSAYGSAVSSIASDEYYFATTTYDTGGVVEFNFGSPPFTISSGNADADGYGNFEYSVPSGYYALCTKNLGAYGG